MKILPLSTIDDNRTILQEVLRIRKYLEENPCRNVFNIDVNYDDSEVAYDKTKVFIPVDFDGSVESGDVIIFKNGYISVIDTVSTDYVVIKADTAVRIRGDKGDTGATGATGNGITSITKTGTIGRVDTYTITFTNGTTTTFQVTNGANGNNGQDGASIYSITKTGTSGLVDTYTITLTNGAEFTFTVTNGANGTNGVGVPAGGTDGQVLTKDGSTDYSTKWADAPGALPDTTNASDGDVLYSGSIDETPPQKGWGGLPIILSDNLIINSRFNINQRGFQGGTINAAKYINDRWYVDQLVEGGSPTFSGPQDEKWTVAFKDLTLSQFIEGARFCNRNTLGSNLCLLSYHKSGTGDCVVSITYTRRNNPTVYTITPIDSGYVDGNTGKSNFYVVFNLPTYDIVWLRVSFGNTNGNLAYIAMPTLVEIKSWNKYIKSALFGMPNTALYTGFLYGSYDKAIELEKCKYYYEFIKNTNPMAPPIHNGINVVNSEFVNFTGMEGSIFIKEKRITPTITSNCAFITYFKTTTNAPDSISVTPTYYNTNGITYLRASRSSIINFLIGQGVNFVNCEIDAEIYP